MQFRGTWSAGPDDDQARFLADLRALRDSAAIGYDELAARAHYPSNILKEAENGPYLPGLPILTAYVRACEGDVLDWEERWRKLNPDVEDDPDLPVRAAGASAAAVAGARAGVGVVPPDVYDPERIKAALRGDHARSERASRRADDPGTSAPLQDAPAARAAASSDHGPDQSAGPAWGAGPSWDPAAETTIAAANGNHSADPDNRSPFEAAFTEGPDSAGRTESAPVSEFSWLRKSTPEARAADSDFAWPGRANAGKADAETASPDPADAEQVPQHHTSSEPAGFWATPAERADLRSPATPRRAEEPADTHAARPAAADTAASNQAAGARSGAATQPAGSGGTGAQATVAEADTPRSDRLFPVRLLVVIVIAALVGSALVMLLK